MRWIGLFLIIWMQALSSVGLKDLEIHSESAILMDGDTHQILFEKNAFKKFSPASITKVPTLVYILKKTQGQHHRVLIADQDAIGSISNEYAQKMKYNYPAHWLVLGGTHLSIRKKEEIKIKDLMYGMMLVSANDAANILAKHVGGSIPGFMTELNKYLKTIGCKNTHLKNPHGLHYPEHMTTAYDMAIITSEGLKDPLFREIFKANRYHLPSTNKQKAKTIVAYNKLLKPGHYYYPFAIGAKTGFHSEAKNTLVAAAQKNGRTLIVVLLKCPSSNQRYDDALLLFKNGFKALKK